ncbi:hypothetical protein [uncultured Pontibacter sp.]|uniref:hypothetical protein n=1 Tax=uncultured Pontibacter sp. TaxID=453356 RepID=UPI00262D2AF2|nr:hypothetical protein [uncultured Pontibacter sp.]
MNKFLSLRLQLWLILAYTLLMLIFFIKKEAMPTLPELMILLFPHFMYVIRNATGEH